MTCFLRVGIVSLVLCSLIAVDIQAANILIMNQAGGLFDQDLIAHLETRGHTVDVLDTGVATPDDQIAEAESHDVIYIAESLGSSSVTDGLKAYIKDVETPIIIAEAFAFDDFAVTADLIHEDFGNTLRGDPPIPELQDGQDALVITDSAHPMAAGLSGTVPVYKEIYSLNFGFIKNFGPGATVVATVDTADAYATLFVYDKGAELKDGTPAADVRIGFYLGQGSGNPQWNNLTENGIALLDASFDYALGLFEFTPGDFNSDGVVDLADFTLLVENFNTTGATFAQGDNNFSGTVDLADFLAFRKLFVANNPAAAAVPEPSAWLLAILGLIGLTRCGVRGRRSPPP